MYVEPKWIFSMEDDTLVHFKGGNKEPFTAYETDDFDVIIPRHYIPELIQFLTDKGYIKPQMSKESREEDLKIVHRLLDIIEKK